MFTEFNHSFENLQSIVCWDTDLKHDDVAADINDEERKMQVVSREGEDDYTRYYLENPRKAHRLEVYVLRDYFKENRCEVSPPSCRGGTVGLQMGAGCRTTACSRQGSASLRLAADAEVVRPMMRVMHTR